MQRSFAAARTDLVPRIAAASRLSRRTLIFLHIQKVGGTTLVRNLRADPNWLQLYLPGASTTRSCACGSADCPTTRGTTDLAGHPDETLANLSISLRAIHEDYSTVSRLRDAVHAAGGIVTEPITMLVRPVRERLTSIFTDYWTQVAEAERAADDRSALTWHEARTLGGYLQDSIHYRDADGRIDGVGWYRAFAEHGSGAPFFLDQVFDGSPQRLEEEARAGRLRLIPTSGLDAFQEELMGAGARTRHRVSRAAEAGAVSAALSDAAPLIDQLATRDARYDALVAELLDDPSFGAQSPTSGAA